MFWPSSGQFPWADISEWLWEACDSIDTDTVVAELHRRPRSVWAKTAYRRRRVRRCR